MKRFLKPFKRIFGFFLFLIAVLFFGCTVYPFLFIFYGAERATIFMDKTVLPIVELWQ